MDYLHKLGFSVGVDEVTRFKQSVVANDDNELGIDVLPGSFSQWSGDNADVKLNSFDGALSLHGMGMVVAAPQIKTDQFVLSQNL